MKDFTALYTFVVLFVLTPRCTIHVTCTSDPLQIIIAMFKLLALLIDKISFTSHWHVVFLYNVVTWKI